MLNNLFLNLNSWWRVLYIHQRVRGVHTLWAVHAMVFGGQTCRFIVSLKVLPCPLFLGASRDGGGYIYGLSLVIVFFSFPSPALESTT
jgi:hypothetical protein